MNLTVCIATAEYPPTIGGVGFSVHRIASQLSQLGYQMHVAVLEKDGYNRAERVLGISTSTTLEGEVTVHRIRVPSRTSLSKARDIETDFYVALRELHRKYNFELFHCFYLRQPALACAIFAVEEGIPYVCSARGSDLHKHVFEPGALSSFVWILRQASWSTYVSESLRRRALALVPEIELRSSTFWNSIDSSVLEELPSVSMPASVSGITIGTLGRFRDKKGCETLLDACAQVAKHHKISVVMIGDFVDTEREYWELVLAKSPISDQIVTLGLMDRRRALAYLQMLDIVVFSSIHDGCPNALLEAMAAARPIIASRVDSLSEIIENGRNGLLADPLNSGEFATKLIDLIHDQDQRLALGSAARADAILRFHPTVEAAAWKNVYESAVTGYA